MTKQPDTLKNLLIKIAGNYPNKAVVFMYEDASTQRLTYKKLLEEARFIAGGLYDLGLKKDDKVIICLKENKDIIPALWGCIYGGIIPTIIQAPLSYSEENMLISKIKNISNILEEAFIISDDILLKNTGVKEEMIILFNEIRRIEFNKEIEILPGDTAYIQFSSGSTDDPKGIVLTNENILVNINSIAIGLQLEHKDSVVSWMPIYHDMGLVGYHFVPLANSVEHILIDTTDFIKNPGLWFDALNKYEAAITGCPNFALALAIRFLKRNKDEKNWNLNKLKAVLNGAEPISVRIMHEFVEEIQKYNFAPQAMMPVYGLAEASLAVTFTPLMEDNFICDFSVEMLDKQGIAEVIKDNKTFSRTIASVGVPLTNISVRITDDNDNELPQNHVGNIQIAGKSVTKGYYNKDNSELFNNQWLKTGDLGFFHENRLFISGRKKDILFISGKKYFANDLELLALSLPHFRLGKIAIAGKTIADSHADKIILFAANIKPSEAEDILEETRQLFKNKLGISIHRLVIVRSNEIPKTSSGKIQRYVLLENYLEGKYKNVFG